jgi:hypothetical protein
MHYVGAVALGISAVVGNFFENDPSIQKIHTEVMQTIEHSESVPGLKSEEFNSIKSGVAERWNELAAKGVLEVTGTDQEIRPYFVALQAIMEHVLAHDLNTNVHALTGVIHTPMPATPLCTKGAISKELVDASIENDKQRLFTVNARTTIVRDYLNQGGDLYIVYPKEGINSRTEEQQKIYQEELANYPSHLFDRPLETPSLATEEIGAFYLFNTTEGKQFAFAIKMTQAKDPQEIGSFGLWFGPFTKNAPVYERVAHIIDNVLKYSPLPIDLPQ